MAETYTEQQYKTLCDAIAQGVKEVKYGDKEITYRSLDEMRSIRREMEKQLFPGKKRTRTKYFTYKSGF